MILENPNRAEDYKEIIELAEYCKKIGINAELEELWDGYVLYLPSGGDFVQHRYSRYSKYGCVEPYINSDLDFNGITLERAKSLVRREKHRLKGRAIK